MQPVSFTPSSDRAISIYITKNIHNKTLMNWKTWGHLKSTLFTAKKEHTGFLDAIISVFYKFTLKFKKHIPEICLLNSCLSHLKLDVICEKSGEWSRKWLRRDQWKILEEEATEKEKELSWKNNNYLVHFLKLWPCTLLKF